MVCGLKRLEHGRFNSSYVQNCFISTKIIIYFKVSIPHRYVQNFIYFLLTINQAMFQFLIGTFKTALRAGEKTLRYCVSIPHRYVQNIAFSNISTSLLAVSIPHRYVQNVNIISINAKKFVVSIPHRYVQNNEGRVAPPTCSIRVSIPHRYVQNSNILSIIRPPPKPVSIPHRYVQNSPRKHRLRLIVLCFNSS